MNTQMKLTTAAACRVTGTDRDRFNEAVAGNFFPCAPKTVPGKARLFEMHDLISLRLYRELLDDGYTKQAAGRVACSVAGCARLNPDADSITYVQTYFMGDGDSFPADKVPRHEDWNTTNFSGSDIRKATTFRVGKLKQLIAHYASEEGKVIGEAD